MDELLYTMYDTLEKVMQRILLFGVICLTFLLLFVGFFHPVTAVNEDLDRHLLLGKIIAESRSVPKTNLLSYTYPDHPFINTHWLSEVIYYGIFLSFGYDGLLVFSTALVLLGVMLVALYGGKRYGMVAIAVPLYFMVNLLLGRRDVRPEQFSFFFLAVFLVILFHFREKHTRFIFLLIPCVLLWVNIHIYFFVGLAVICIFLIAQYIANKGVLTRSVKTLLFVFLLSSLAVFINPNGFHGVFAPVTLPMNYGYPVLENNSFFTLSSIHNESSIIFLKLLIVPLAASFFLARRKIQVIHWLLTVVFLVAALVVYRNLPLFAYAVFIPFVIVFPFLLTAVRRFLLRYLGSRKLLFITNYTLCILCLVLIGQIGQAIRVQGFGFGVKPHGKAAIDFIKEENLSGTMFNNFNLGGYVAAQVYPKKVYIDNRPEAYPVSFFKDTYIPMMSDPRIFEAQDRKYNYSSLYISHWDGTPWKSEFISYLLDHPKYALVYLDEYVMVYAKRTQENEAVINNHTVTQHSFALDSSLPKDTLVRYIILFEKIGWEDQENRAFASLLKLDPQACSLSEYQGYLKQSNSFSSLRQKSAPCLFVR